MEILRLPDVESLCREETMKPFSHVEEDIHITGG